MRPTDYNPEILERALHYLANFKELGDVVPTVAGMACEIGVSRETIYAWSKDETKPEFSDILMQVMEKQERNLVNGGLAGGFNPAVTKMLLTKHGYSDKSEVVQDVTVRDGETLAEKLTNGSKR
jgi:DNA-binding phage protein